MNEQWRDIPGFPGYQCSQDGKIKSLRRFLVRSNGRPFTVPERIVKNRVGTKGYLHVGLYVNKARVYRPVARLVYMTWVGPIPAGMEIDHIDQNNVNNHVSNLQPLTKEENGRKARLYQLDSQSAISGERLLE